MTEIECHVFYFFKWANDKYNALLIISDKILLFYYLLLRLFFKFHYVDATVITVHCVNTECKNV